MSANPRFEGLPPWAMRPSPKSNHYRDVNGYAPPTISAIEKHLGKARLKITKGIYREDQQTTIELIEGYHNFLTRQRKLVTPHRYFKDQIKRDYLVLLSNFFLQVYPIGKEPENLEFLRFNGFLEYLEVKSLLAIHPAEFLFFEKSKTNKSTVVLGVDSAERYEEILRKDVYKKIRIEQIERTARFPKEYLNYDKI